MSQSPLAACAVFVFPNLFLTLLWLPSEEDGTHKAQGFHAVGAGRAAPNEDLVMAKAVVAQRLLLVVFLCVELQYSNSLAQLSVAGNEPWIQLSVLRQSVSEQLLRVTDSPWGAMAHILSEEHHVNRLSAMP